MRCSNRRAMALVMVVMVLAILVVIGTPFAVSMLLQEKSSRSYLEDTRARFAAEGARNHAVSVLSRSHDSLERARGAKAPFDNPYVDGVPQIAVDLAGLAALKLPIADPKGTIWGVEVQDEQGKLNKRTVPARVLQTLDGILGANPGPKWRFVTEHSQRPAAWVFPQTVRALTLDQNGLDIMTDNRTLLKIASRVRLTKGKEQLIGTTAELTDLLGRRGHDFDPPGTVVEIESIHPVNPNVAPREVIAAVFTGLAARTLNPNQIQKMIAKGEVVPPQHHVDAQEAMALAEKIVGLTKPFDTPRSFFDFLHGEAESGTITESDAAALYINSVNPFDGRLVDQDSEAWLGTVPFCYDSTNVYLVEATGISNNPAGNEAGRRVIRDVVEVAPPEKLTWSIESQFDFDREMWRGQGNRMVSWPQRSFVGGDPTATQLAGEQKIPAMAVGEAPSLDRSGVGFLTQRAPPDRRNPGNIKYQNSWNDRHEGLNMSDAMTFDPNQIGMSIPQGQVDMDAGAVEFWVRFPLRSPDTCFLDVAQKQRENRLNLEYDSSRGELVLMACDATVDRMASEVRAKVAFEQDTWYHISAIWKSTKYAQLCLLVDGFPKGTFQIVDMNNANSVTTLASALDETTTNVQVNSTAGYPQVGVIEVGDEAIEYAAKTGNSFTGCKRGARETGSAAQQTANNEQPDGTIPKDPDSHPYPHLHAHNHPAGAAVVPFGYYNFLNTISLGFPPLPATPVVTINIDRIPAVKGTVRDNFGANPQAQIAGRQGIKPTDTTIVVGANPSQQPAPASPTQDFPSKGYIQIGTEVVYYSGKGTDRFTGCQRGQLGTAAAAWPMGVPVWMWAIPVTDAGGYLDPGIIQIDDEWIVCHPMPNGVDGAYMSGFMVGPLPIPMFRGVVIGPPAAHMTGAKVLPVFSTLAPWCGAQDMVTIVTKNQTQSKEQMKVRHAGQFILPAKHYYLAAFDDFQKNTYKDDGITRLMKFPSGELPSVVSNPVTFGAEAPGVANGSPKKLLGTIDDLRFFSNNRGDLKTDAAVKPGDKQVTVNQIPSPDQGAIKLGDELVGYVGSAGKGPVTLGNLKRGYLKSQGQAHGTGERFVNMSFMSVTSLTAAMDDKAVTIPGKSPQGFAPHGFALVDDEVIGYYQDPVAGTPFVIPADKKGDGMFRGSFGTQKAGHNPGALVYALPFRYFDFSRQEAWDNQMNYFQASLHAAGAKFQRLHWEETRRMDRATIRVLARVDGQPAWDETPTNRPGGLYEFTQHDGRNELNVSGDELQVQVRFEYRQGAFDDDTWKYSPKLKGLYVEYVQPEVVRSHEEE